MTTATTNPLDLFDSRRFRTPADWWDSLGNVPLDRIITEPLPGMATDQDVICLNDHEDRLCELVDGTLVEKTMGYEESLIAGRIIYLLSMFVVPRKLGLVSAPDGMLKILANRVRIPDVAFISFARLPNRRIPTQPIPSLVPDLAVEVISNSNTPKEMAIKLLEYFEAGVRLVWYVDPKTQSVEAYTAPDKMIRVAGADMLTGGEVLPGFSVLVSDIFDVI